MGVPGLLRLHYLFARLISFGVAAVGPDQSAVSPALAVALTYEAVS